MTYSVSHHSPYLREGVEVRCPWNQLGQVTSLLKGAAALRVCVTEVDKERLEAALPQLNKLKELTNEYTISCGDVATMQGLISNGYHAFLRYPVCDWETYSSLKQLGVSDIYIDGPLGFQTNALSSSKGDMKLRVSPQVSPNIALLSLDDNENSFYIRPEDLHLYEDIIDVIDFRERDQEKENVLYNIYNRGTWNGDLRELVDTLNLSVRNPYLKTEFGEARLNCRQHCKIPGSACHLCRTQFELTNMVFDYFN